MKTEGVRSVLYLSAGLGFVVSLFAAAEFFDASLRGICSVNAFFSCALVDRSGRTATLGLPDYLWGIGGFVAIFVAGGLAEARPADPTRAYVLVGITSAGVALSAYLLYVELGEIRALCIVCATAYAFGVLAWAASLGLARRVRRGEDDSKGPHGAVEDRDPA